MSSHALRLSVDARRTSATTHRVIASANISTSSVQAYRTIADYRRGHPSILPAQYFRNLRVIEGGYGAGTVITFDVVAFGRIVAMRSRVTEPVPGRVLVESDTEKPLVTTFTVDSNADGTARVSFDTTFQTGPGLLGRVEGWMTRAFLKRVYAAELDQFDAYVRKSAS